MGMEEQFAYICKESEVFENRGVCFRLDEETEVALFKIKGVIYACDNVCPHNHIPVIFKGYLNGENVSCPVHGFEFNLITGDQPNGAGCKLRIFEVKTEEGDVYIKKPEEKIFDFDF